MIIGADKDRSLTLRGTQPLPLLYAHLGWARGYPFGFTDEDYAVIKMVNRAWTGESPFPFQFVKWLERRRSESFLIYVTINHVPKGQGMYSMPMRYVHDKEFIYFFKPGGPAKNHPAEARLDPELAEIMRGQGCAGRSAFPFVERCIRRWAKQYYRTLDEEAKHHGFKHAGKPVSTLEDLRAMVVDTEEVLKKTGKVPEWLASDAG